MENTAHTARARVGHKRKASAQDRETPQQKEAWRHQ